MIHQTLSSFIAPNYVARFSMFSGKIPSHHCPSSTQNPTSSSNQTPRDRSASSSTSAICCWFPRSSPRPSLQPRHLLPTAEPTANPPLSAPPATLLADGRSGRATDKVTFISSALAIAWLSTAGSQPSFVTGASKSAFTVSSHSRSEGAFLPFLPGVVHRRPAGKVGC